MCDTKINIMRKVLDCNGLGYIGCTRVLVGTSAAIYVLPATIGAAGEKGAKIMKVFMNVSAHPAGHTDLTYTAVCRADTTDIGRRMVCLYLADDGPEVTEKYLVIDEIFDACDCPVLTR